ncbi:MAG TPA: FAD-dependent oxidoreductase [Micromonosporaceae bacterium]|nr:FAD-dependent oxidoreductase [Micromonosporaceae bacterium]
MADVCVIGAGVAGLTAALWLRQADHTVTVLEAKPQAGGLSTTVRRGDVLCEIDAEGRAQHQTAGLDAGLYVNAGPGRLPHHHRRILALCDELGVALEPYVMSSDANYYVDASTGERYRRRRIEHDARGHLAELAYSGDDAPALRELVRSFGDLDERGRYAGTMRAGDGEVVPVGRLAGLGFWRHRFWQPLSYLWQDSMFQPVGGMDWIWQAMLGHVGDAVVYNAPVERIATSRGGVEVVWREGGRRASKRFDWCLSSIPLPILGRMLLDGFTKEYRKAIRTPSFAAACKVGWQSEQRWWESDVEQIYGGISYTDADIQQFWYPSAVGPVQGPATLTGAYAAYGAAERLGALSVAERIDTARKQGSLIHAQVADEALVPTRKAVTVAWHRVPYQAGGWCDWQPGNPAHAKAFAALQVPAGRFCVIGDQVSSWPGWQEGCLESVERATAYIDGGLPRLVAEVPDSRWLTMGDYPWGPENHPIQA